MDRPAVRSPGEIARNRTKQMPSVPKTATNVMPAVVPKRRHKPMSAVTYVTLWTCFWTVIILLGLSVAIALRLMTMAPSELRINCDKIPGIQHWSSCVVPE